MSPVPTVTDDASADQAARRKQTVHIAFNGMNASFEYGPEQHAEHVRVQALNHYDVRGPERHQDFLFGPDNQTEIKDDATMASQVEPGSQLYLRPRTAPGGALR
jgi:hypothetical protein